MTVFPLLSSLIRPHRISPDISNIQRILAMVNSSNKGFTVPFRSHEILKSIFQSIDEVSFLLPVAGDLTFSFIPLQG